MDNFNLTTPVLKDNKWLIFPDTIFDRLEVMDCNDSIDGTCHTDKNFDQCIKTCDPDSCEIRSPLGIVPL